MNLLISCINEYLLGVVQCLHIIIRTIGGWLQKFFPNSIDYQSDNVTLSVSTKNNIKVRGLVSCTTNQLFSSEKCTLQGAWH